MSYALTTLWYERQRYLPGILAVGFSALLIALQSGLLLGLFSITSIPVDYTDADIWIGSPNVLSVDLGQAIPEDKSIVRLANQPEVIATEPFNEGFAYWGKEKGDSELCIVVGSRLEDSSLGALKPLTHEQRNKLTEPRAIIVDRSEMPRLGVERVGDYAEISGLRVRIVDTVEGFKSLAGPYVFCSLETSRELLRHSLRSDETKFVLAKCKPGSSAQDVVNRLKHKYDNISSFTKAEFSRRTQLQWLLKTRAGIALGFAAALGLLVGAVVTSQTLYAATAASLREYAVLRALGIPRWRMAASVLAQSFWVGFIGIAVAVPAVYGMSGITDLLGGAKIMLPPELIAGACLVTMIMALLSGLAALRSLRLIEPATLLR
jgi:putative ABC transport system permease protein